MDLRVLALDVGNTNTSVGLFHHEGLQKAFKVPTGTEGKELWTEVEREISESGGLSRPQVVAISSVVKGKGEELKRSLEDLLASQGLRPPRIVILDQHVKWPLVSAYRGNLGTDRILAAIAGAKLYGKPTIIVDIGSAVTVDLVDSEGVFRGGIILAGAGMRARALAEFTSALPLISIPEKPPPLIGTDTVECMSSGLYHGMRQEIKGLVEAFQQELRESPVVVVTGQGNRLFRAQTPPGWQLDDWLVVKGIWLVVGELEP